MRRRVALTITAVALGALAGPAGAVTTGGPRLYWGIEGEGTQGQPGAAESLVWAPLDGSGPVQVLATTGATVSAPNGIALDPSRGFIYWVNWWGGQVSRANLDGSGGGRDLYYATGSAERPVNVAVDPNRNVLYWTLAGGPTVTAADVGAAPVATGLESAAADGTGTPVPVQVQAPDAPVSTTANTLALDANAGVLYWTTDADLPAGGAIRRTTLATGATQVMPVAAANASIPDGLAVDAGAGWAMFTNFWSSVTATPPLGIAQLNGSGASAVDPGVGTPTANPMGIAIDPHAGVAYWSGSPTVIRRTQVGAPYATATTYSAAAPAGSQVTYMAILAPPRALAAPHLVGEGTAALPLSCGPATWEADRGSLQYYSAPATLAYGWERNGTPVPGATASSLTTAIPGAYTCTVTAANAAGTTSTTSAPRHVAAVHIRSVRANRESLLVRATASDAGRLTLVVTIGRTRVRACVAPARRVTGPATVTMRCSLTRAVRTARTRRSVPVRIAVTLHPRDAAMVVARRSAVLPGTPAVTG